ncbi:MAG TPA: CorA family divalent cation transporter [Nitrospiraceae bacterium]|jgi:magnesium transporter|nr:CorA family divalent cation transporter [Nitrospiraceae bacterium]
MNFEHMPELKSTWGYPIVLVAMTVVGLGMLILFRNKRWL